MSGWRDEVAHYKNARAGSHPLPKPPNAEAGRRANDGDPGGGYPARFMQHPDDPLLRHAPTRVHGRYFVRPSASTPAHWLIGFHGQGQTAEAFLADLERIPRGPDWLVASIQGLNRHYAGRTQAIVASWMTSQDRELAIADNLAWVDTALDQIEREFGSPRSIVFAGFSQGVAMAYRAGLLGSRSCAAILAGNGDVPPELKTASGRAWPLVLVATGTRDEWYTPARLAADAEVLRSLGAEVRTLTHDGAHEWTNELAEAAGRLLAGIAGRVAGAEGA
jgi:predicted esterase